MSDTQQYAISQYPDVADIYRRLEELVSQPMRRVREERMQEYLAYFDKKCARSKALTDKAKRFIPGGVQHNLAFNHPFPIAIEKAEGAYLWDVDGNKYIDFLQAGAPIVLGSNYAPVRDKVIELLHSCGPVTGLFHDGSHPGGACIYSKEEGYQGRRRVPRLERFDGFRYAHTRHRTDGSHRHPGWC
jgi:hypothetical protein